MRGRARSWLPPVAVIAGMATLAAQQPARAPTFRSGVELVQVDVVVADRQGRHVRGLTAADFAVYDREKPQTIAAFEEVSHERAATAVSGRTLPPTLKLDVASNRNAQSQRLVVLVVDDLHIYRGRTERARGLARQIVSQLGPQASMAVLFTSGNGSTQVTEDRSLVFAAIDTLKGRKSWPRPHAAGDTQRSSVNPDARLDQPLVAGGGQPAIGLQEFFENMRQYRTLQDAARMVGSGDARRKAFVLLTEGIAKDLTGVFDADVTPCESRCPTCPCYHDLALRDMMESMRRANVATYVIDPRGNIPSEKLLAESFPGDDSIASTFRWNNPIRQAQDALSTMADASGGFAVTNSDNLDAGLAAIIEDLDHYYLIGFYPADKGGKKYRPLQVMIPGHPEWILRFRRGYKPGGPPEPPRNRNPLASLSAGVLPSTDLPLRLTAIPIAGSGKDARVVLALELSAPVSSLVEADGRLRDDLKYLVIAANIEDNKARSVAGLEGRMTLSPNETKFPRPDVVTYQVTETIELAPGKYHFRASASSTKLARGGSVYFDLEVPDFRSSPLAVSGLALGYAAGPRIPTASLSTAAGRRSRSVVTAPGNLPLPFSPSLDREFSTADTLRLYFEVSGSRLLNGAQSSVVLWDSEGRSIRQATPRLQIAAGRAAVDMTIPLRDLPAGAYALRVVASNGTTSASRDTGLVVR